MSATGTITFAYMPELAIVYRQVRSPFHTPIPARVGAAPCMRTKISWRSTGNSASKRIVAGRIAGHMHAMRPYAAKRWHISLLSNVGTGRLW